MDKLLKGQSISRVSTLKSWFDNDCVRVVADGVVYRMSTDVIKQMLNEFYFKVERKRVYSHLVEAIPIDEVEDRTALEEGR